MLLQIAWKNIWRNKVRSLVILTAIALGIFAGVFNMAFYYGMVDQRIEAAISNEASHIQIHQNKYLSDPNLETYIPDAERIKSEIDTMSEVAHTSVRVLVNSMISSAETGSGIRIVGIVPDDEKEVTNIHTHLISGEYLTGISRNPIVVGQKLADKLKIKLRSKVVLTLQSVDGEMIYASFRVAGIYSTSNTMFDEMNAFVRKSDIRKLVGLGPTAGHEIAILLKSNESLDTVKEKLTADYPGLDIKTWKEILPEVGLVEQSMDLSMYVLMGIILFALLFGIINTMLMAVLERQKELGMLMAIGMNKRRVFSMIMLETVMLSIIGGIAGILIGGIITEISSHTGIDLSAVAKGYEYLGYDSIVYPVYKIDMIIKVTIMVLATGFIAALYPARKALKLRPAEAIRIDL